MVARTQTVLNAGNIEFVDEALISSWARSYVYTVFSLDFMIGDNNDMFRPQARITRAEVATTVNRVLGRIDSQAALSAANLQNPEAIRSFPDVTEGRWYFASVIAATNNHRLTRNDAEAIIQMEILPD
jgi:hypothetical protein